MTENSYIYTKQEINEIIPKLDVGHLIPLQVRGKRMNPALKEGYDTVYILKAFIEPQRGSVVLCRRDDGFELTRVCKVNQKGIFVMADKDTVSRGPLKLSDCIAVVQMTERNGKLMKNGIVSWYFGSARVMAKDFISDVVKSFELKRGKKANRK